MHVRIRIGATSKPVAQFTIPLLAPDSDKSWLKTVEFIKIKNTMPATRIVPISDVVNANILASENDNIGNAEVLNIGSGKSYSVMDLVKMIDGNHIYIPPRIGESRHTLADISKAEELLGWSPKVNLEDWLEENK